VEKIKVAVLGSGNIGTDLMFKLLRSPILEVTTVIGIDENSEGLKIAREQGLHIITNGIEGFLQTPELADFVFDATSAYAHIQHAQLLKDAGKVVLDLTPAAVGPFIVPTVNLQDNIDIDNINLITCGGQATIPIIHAINRVHPVEYAEIIATISSKSAGPGTRANIDEFTRTTAKGIEVVGGAKKGKAIIILNPAEPPIMMRDAIHVVIKGEVNESAIIQSIKKMVMQVKQYVPGYRLKQDPMFDGNTISVFVEVEGTGDYLPKFAGNLDIMTAAAVKVAEVLAQHKVDHRYAKEV
jgi:acetaldehyde dehydrogenase (acetylating)